MNFQSIPSAKQTEYIDAVLLAQKELFQLCKLAFCTDKVCSFVAPNGTRTASKADESPQRCDERIRREILDHFQMIMGYYH